MTRRHRPVHQSLALGAALVAVLAAAACGGGSKSNTPNVTAPTARDAQVTVDDVNGAKASPECAAQVKTLRIVTYGNVSSAARNAKTYLEGAHPGLAVDLSSTATSYAEVVSQISADKAAGRQTDVAVAGYEFLTTFVNNLGAQELSPKLLRASYDQRFLRLGQLNGKQYGIPQQVSLPVLMYNENLFKKAGVDPQTLRTTDGVLLAIDKLKAAGVQRPVDLPTEFGYWFLDSMAHSQGTGLQGPNGQPAYNTPAALAAMQFLAAVGKSSPQSNNATTQGALTFGLQRSASIGATVAAVGAVRQLLAGRGSQAFPVGVVPFPTLPGGTLTPVTGGNSLVVLSADRCQREMATEAVVALLSPDVLASGIQATSYLSIDKQATERLADFYTKNPDLKALNDLAPQLVAPPTWPGARGSEIPKVTEDEVTAVVGGKDPQAALTELQNKTTDLTR
ncbi:MAG: multiple sugar transport system substrate-binding protein [Frankiaceae bacterium]|nr:multiple sugar transport system substrate-binding protein [Frankiaceae bacterium]